MTRYVLDHPRIGDERLRTRCPQVTKVTVDAEARQVTVTLAAAAAPDLLAELDRYWRDQLDGAAEVVIVAPAAAVKLPADRLAEHLQDRWEHLVGTLNAADAALLHLSFPELDAANKKLTVAVDGADKAEMLAGRVTDTALAAAVYAETGHQLTVAFQASDRFRDQRAKLLGAARLREQETRNARRADRERLAQLILLGDEVKTEPQPFAQLARREGKIAILAGKAGSYLARAAGKGWLHTFDLYGRDGAVRVKHFRPYRDQEPLPVVEGKWLKVQGRLAFDEFDQEIVLEVSDINRFPEPVRADTAARKRIELHAHTQMSTRDALTPVKGLIARAARWGHPAVAITDHGNVQAYPEAYALAKKYGIRLIFGMEGYLVDDELPPVYNLKTDRPLAGLAATLLELRTEGADPLRHRITGCTRWRLNGKRVGKALRRDWDPAVAGDELAALAAELGDDPVIAFDSARAASFLRLAVPARLENPFIDLNLLGRYLVSGWQAGDSEPAEFWSLLVEQAGRQGVSTLNELNRFRRTADHKAVGTYHVILLVRNRVGLKNLYTLVSKSHTDYFYRKPLIPRSTLAKYRDGLLVGSACEKGELIQKILKNAPEGELKAAASFYDYLEIQPLGNNRFLAANGTVAGEDGLRELNRKVCALAVATERLTVATSDVHFLDPEDELYRRVLQIGQGYKDADREIPLYFRTTDEMLAEFAYLGADAATAAVIDNPARVASFCEMVPPIPSGFYSPKLGGAEKTLRQMVIAALGDYVADPVPPLVRERVDREVKAIINNGFADLYLIAHKLVKKSLADGYIVGSRGSVGSSLVAHLCGITEVNPLPAHYRCPKCRTVEFIVGGRVGLDLPRRSCPRCGTDEGRDGYDIPFEVFVGFKGDKVPDIDLNFSGEYQARAHRFVEELMGKENCFRAGTVSTYQAKQALGLARKYEEATRQTLTRAERRRLAHALVGTKQANGQHPGGIVLVPKTENIVNFCPVNYPREDHAVLTTHFDYHEMESQLVKLDVLGHDAPTTLRLLFEHTGIDPLTVPLDDPLTLQLFTTHKVLKVRKADVGNGLGVLGIPEFGTQLGRRMLGATRPTTIEELVLIAGLEHGEGVWGGNAETLIKKGTATLRDVIAVRDNIMNDLIRQKIPPESAFEIMERVRKGRGLTPPQMEQMRAAGVTEWYITSCNQIKYMFPKAHAVAYTLMALRVAYFKLHHPAAFYAAHFTNKVGEFDPLMVQGGVACRAKLKELTAAEKLEPKEEKLIPLLEVACEFHARGFKFFPVDVHQSDPRRFLVREGGLLPPLIAVPGLGLKAAEKLAVARAAAPFTTVRDLADRGGVNKAQVEALRAGGSLAALPEREQMDLL